MCKAEPRSDYIDNIHIGKTKCRSIHVSWTRRFPINRKVTPLASHAVVMSILSIAMPTAP